MPFRYLFKKGGVDHPVGYSLLMLAGAMVVMMMAAVMISTEASDRAVRESERKQCESVTSDVHAFEVVPPVTQAGKAQLATKRELLIKWECPIPPDPEEK